MAQEDSEYGGGPGQNRRLPNGQRRPLSVREEAREMRRAGLREAAGLRPETPAEIRARQVGRKPS
jgi:hypothetical protein